MLSAEEFARHGEIATLDIPAYGRHFDTAEYVQSWKARSGAILLLLGFALQALGACLSGAPR
jgi:hypothetical protein